MPVGVRPPWVNTSKPRSVRRASMATTQHCVPNSSAISLISSGRSTADVFTDTLSAPARSRRRASSTRADAAADRERDEHLLGHAGGHLDGGVAGVGRRGDVEEHELVGALGVVAGRQLDRVAGVDEVDEVHALDDAAVVDVEARDDAGGLHASAAHRLGHVDAALVDRGADDGAGEPAVAGRRPRRGRAGRRACRRRRRR